MKPEDIQTMLSGDRLEYRDPSKRNIWPWHLCAIYALLTLCIMMAMLSLVSIHHLHRRQKDNEMKLASSSCTCFDAYQSVNGKDREPASDGESQDEDVNEDDVDELRAMTSDTDSGYTDESVGVAESNQSPLLGTVLHRIFRNTEPSNSALSWRNSEEARARISAEIPSDHQTPVGEVTSVPNGLSIAFESSSTALSGQGLPRRLSRETRGTDEETEETISVRHQDRKQSRKPGRTTNRNRRIKQQKNETGNRFQGMAAIHLQAPEHMDRQYESGPVVSLNASYTRDTVYRFWRKASWVQDDVADVFHLDETTGHVTVEIGGLYMIYAQMVYHDLSGRWSFGIYVGDQEKVKCLATEQLRDLHAYHPTSHGVYQSCYTAIVLHIRKNQSVSIRCMYGSRTILTRPEFTFWGMVRLS